MGKHTTTPPATATGASAKWVWVASAVTALALSTGIGATQAGWTQAIIANSTNTAATGTAVVLKETSGTNTCLSSADVSNSSTCATINKYGGTTTPLVPGTSQSVDVTFSNVGQASAASFALTPGACGQTPAAATGTIADLCATGDLTVAVSCSNGTSYVAASAWTDLAYAAAAPGTLSAKTHTAAMAANSSWTCRFTVALGTNAPVTAQGITVSQPLT